MKKVVIERISEDLVIAEELDSFSPQFILPEGRIQGTPIEGGVYRFDKSIQKYVYSESKTKAQIAKVKSLQDEFFRGGSK